MIPKEKLMVKVKKLTVGFGLLFLFQVVMLIYVNLTQMQMHMGYDASGHYLTVLEMWKQKAWMLDNWQRNTSLLFDTSAPLAVWLMPVFHNVFTAYGTANLIIDGVLIVAVWMLARELDLVTEARLFILCVLFCPYLGINFNNYNDLMYFSMMYTNCAPYNVKLLLTVLFWLGFVSLQNKNFRGGCRVSIV